MPDAPEPAPSASDDDATTLGSVSADLTWCSKQAIELARDLAECWIRLFSGIVRGPDSSLPDPDPELPTTNPRIDVTVSHRLTARPLTLEVHGFRAIGWGGLYDIPATAVTIQLAGAAPTGSATGARPVLPRGMSSFVVSVSSADLPEAAKRRTIVYEGQVTAPEAGGPVADPIRFVKPAVRPTP